MHNFFSFRAIAIASSQIEPLVTKIKYDTSFKGAYIGSKTSNFYKDQKLPLNLRKTYCKEIFLTNSEVIYSAKDFYLIDEINQKIELLKSAGLIEFWHSTLIDKKLFEIHDVDHPKVLKLVKFLGSFSILLLGSLISFSVFAIELMLSKASSFKTYCRCK